MLSVWSRKLSMYFTLESNSITILLATDTFIEYELQNKPSVCVCVL